MDIAPFKTGKRGRPRFRRFRGFVSLDSPGLLKFVPSDPDLFGLDSVLLFTEPDFFPVRSRLFVQHRLALGQSIEVCLAFSGKSVEDRFFCRFLYFVMANGDATRRL